MLLFISVTHMNERGFRNLEGEELMGYVASNWLKRGRRGFGGYGIYATNKRLIGIKMRKGVGTMILLGHHAGKAVMQAESAKTLQKLDQKEKDFEIAIERISEIEITKPGTIKGGRLKIMTEPQSDIEITIGGKKEFESIRDLMKAILPKAVKVQE
jgi:hypothetical protein